MIMLVLGTAAVILPAPPPVEHGPTPASEVSPISTCPLMTGSGRSTQIAVLSSPDAEGRVSSFSSGEETGSIDFLTNESGSVTIDAEATGAVGVSGGLIEMPNLTTAVGVMVRGESSRAAESCVDIPSGESFLSGGSTAGENRFDLQLLNPYAGEAIVDLTVTTDAGIESDERFDAVRVPALSSVTMPMTDIIPGREEISVNVQVTTGSAMAVGRQVIGDRTALWRAVEPAQEWWLPIPEGAGTKQLLIASPTNTEVEYQIDYYGTEGLEEAFESGALEPRGRQRVGLAAISTGTAGLRLISTGPVVPSLWINSPQGLAVTTASPVTAPSWLLPGGRSGGTSRIVLLNPGIEAVTVEVLSLRDEPSSLELNLPAASVAEVAVTGADGYRVEASGPVVALWTTRVDRAGTAAIGIPVQDG